MRGFIHDRRGASAAEFALVLPLLMLFLFGIIDVGRWMWTYNQAEKATQMGARMAVVTQYVAGGLGGSYVGASSLTQGDLIPSTAFGKVACTNTSCSCAPPNGAPPCPPGGVGTYNTAAFTNVVDRMKLFLPQVSAANVEIEYSSSGLGYAGNPNGPDVSPLVTVKIGNPATPLQFTPITSLLLTSLTMPSFTTTLTAEDLSGSQSN